MNDKGQLVDKQLAGPILLTTYHNHITMDKQHKPATARHGNLIIVPVNNEQEYNEVVEFIKKHKNTYRSSVESWERFNKNKYNVMYSHGVNMDMSLESTHQFDGARFDSSDFERHSYAMTANIAEFKAKFTYQILPHNTGDPVEDYSPFIIKE